MDWVSGACLLVRRHDAEAVGLLDERYFLYTEDVDFCAALRARGRRVLFTPAAEVTHLRGRSRASAADAMNPAYRRSHVAFYEKHHPRWAPVLRAYLRVRRRYLADGNGGPMLNGRWQMAKAYGKNFRLRNRLIAPQSTTGIDGSGDRARLIRCP